MYTVCPQICIRVVSLYKYMHIFCYLVWVCLCIQCCRTVAFGTMAYIVCRADGNRVVFHTSNQVSRTDAFVEGHWNNLAWSIFDMNSLSPFLTYWIRENDILPLAVWENHAEWVAGLLLVFVHKNVRDRYIKLFLSYRLACHTKNSCEKMMTNVMLASATTHQIIFCCKTKVFGVDSVRVRENGSQTHSQLLYLIKWNLCIRNWSNVCAYCINKHSWIEMFNSTGTESLRCADWWRQNNHWWTIFGYWGHILHIYTRNAHEFFAWNAMWCCPLSQRVFHSHYSNEIPSDWWANNAMTY